MGKQECDDGMTLVSGDLGWAVLFLDGSYRRRREMLAMVKGWKVGHRFLMGQGVFTLAVGMALCSLGSFMTNPKAGSLGYILAVSLTAASLLGQAFIAYSGLLANKVWRHRELYIYFSAGMFSVVCWLVFWLYRLAPLDVLVLLAGLYGLLWSILYIGLTFHLHASSRKAGMLCVLAATTSVIGIILSTQSNLSDIGAVTAVACYMIWIGIQALLTAPYLFRNWKNRTAEGTFSVGLGQ